MEFVTPPALEPGDRIAVLAPSGPPSEPWFSVGLERLRETFGLDPVVYDSADPERSEPAPPERRAAEVERAFRNPEVAGAMAVTGGDDQLRVLKHLDGDVLRENPTRFYGYSDNDNLRLFLWNRGVVSYGAQLMPSVALDPELHPYTERYLRRALFEPSLGAVDPAEEWSQDLYEFDGEPREWQANDGPEWVVPGREDGGDGPGGEDARPRDGDDAATPGPTVSGRVWGGCASILSWQLQTGRYLPAPDRLDGAVLALETSETVPRPADVGYLLRSMGERGLLGRFDGVVVGRPRTENSTLPWTPDRETYRTELRTEILAQLDEYAPDTPAVFGLDFGHTDPHLPLPLGARVDLAPDSHTATFH